MKKRLLSMLMVVLMVVALLPSAAFAAKACDHEYTTITITKDAAAKTPGVNAEVCWKCGEVKSCVITPFVETPVVAPKGDICKVHQNPVSVTVKEAGCESAGLRITYCADCGSEIRTAKITPTGIKGFAHEFDFTVYVKPTCTEDGWGYAICKNCGKPYIVDGPETAKALGADKDTVKAYTKTGHTMKYVTTAVDLNEDGAINWTEVYGVRDLFPKMSATHYETVAGQKLVVLGTASTPLDSFAVGVDNYGMGYRGDKVCATCGAVEYATDTYGEKAFIKSSNDSHKCGYWSDASSVKGYLPWKELVDGAYVYHDGMTDRWHCQKGNTTEGGHVIPYEEYFAIELLPTGNMVEGAIAPTCETPGNTGSVWAPATVKDADGNVSEGWVLVSEGKEIPALGHNWIPVADRPATCYGPGYVYQNAYFCTNCEKYEYNNLYDPDVVKAVSVVPALAHQWHYVDLVEATCENRGISVKECTLCGFLTVEDAYYTKPVAHKAVTVKAVDAGCNTKGYTGDQVCQWCGTMIEQGKVTDPVGHKVELKDLAPTCTEPGYRQRGVCSVCGDVIIEGTLLPALGHDFKYGTCTRCGAVDGEYPVEPTADPVEPTAEPVEPTVEPTAEPVEPTVEPYVNPFVDVADDAYYAPAVQWAVENGVTTGMDKEHFAPNAACTRAQMVTFLWRAAGSPVVEDVENPFSDVKADHYFYDAVMWAVSEGITKGTSDTTFSPNATVTRAQVVTFLYRYAEEPVSDVENPFSDVSANAYYYNAVLWAVENEITTGKTATSFAPNDDCTRAQIVTFMCRDLAK